MNILILGGCGFVGSSLANEFAANDAHKITLIDDLSQGYRERIKEIASKIKLIEQKVEIFLPSCKERFDVIVNCAAIAPLPDNQINHYKSLNKNVALLGSIVDFMRKTGSSKLIHFSSSAVYEYGNPHYSDEGQKLQPRLMYPISKVLSEYYLEAITKSYSIDVTAIRLYNLYGPRQDYFRKQPPFLGYLIKNHLMGNPITVFANKDAKRDYVFIDDLIDFIKLDIQRSFLPNHFAAYNIGSGHAFSIYDLMEMLGKITGKPVNYSIGESKTFWEKYETLKTDEIKLPDKFINLEINKVSTASLKKVEKHYGWLPKVKMLTGLEKCVRYAERFIL